MSHNTSRKMTRERVSLQVCFIKVNLHECANMSMTEKSQHQIPHIVFASTELNSTKHRPNRRTETETETKNTERDTARKQSATSPLLLRCLHSLLVHAEQSLLFLSLLQLSPSKLLFVFHVFIHASDDAPFRKEKSHVQVRLLVRRDVKTV